MGRPPNETFPAPKNPKNIALALDGETAAGLQRFVEQEQARLRDEGADWRDVTMNRVVNRACLLYLQNLIRTKRLPAEEPEPEPAKQAKRKR